jgi:hypothetical protein
MNGFTGAVRPPRPSIQSTAAMTWREDRPNSNHPHTNSTGVTNGATSGHPRRARWLHYADQVPKPRDHSYASRVPAVGELVRCTDGSWMTRPPQSCPHGHLLRPGAMLVGHQPCSTCRGGHTTWTCLDCGGVVYGPPDPPDLAASVFAECHR